MGNFAFSSKLEKKYREDLENLLFFNPQQHQIQDKIIEVIERYGLPEIFEKDGNLQIKIEKLTEVQTLYAFREEDSKNMLVGVMVYVRNDPHTIVILHIGIHEKYSVTGDLSQKILIIHFVNLLKNIARKIKGINHIVLLYGRGKEVKINI
jgi:hypothetical protein